MGPKALIFAAAIAFCAGLLGVRVMSDDAKSSNVLTGQAAFSSYQTEKPGVFRKITAADLPAPYATSSANNPSTVVARPANAWPQSLPGFQVKLYADGFNEARELRTAPNGDIFLADSISGQIKALHGLTADGKAESVYNFAQGLDRPFGIAFYPPGPNPQWVYIGETGAVVRYPYHNGDLIASGKAETIVPSLPSGEESVGGGGHWTRDIVFSRDGKKMYVSVGSQANVADPDTTPREKNRADVLEFNPDGSGQRVYASGIRNCVGEAIQPDNGDLWCSTNERDDLGDDVPPDYITHVQDGGFYGWPYYYIGGHQDPRFAGRHPELKNKVIVPDVLLQPHDASLEMTFYEGAQFPADYRGDIFAAEHGSWNKKLRTGYEVIRVPMDHGKATGAYEDFLTGFVTPEGKVWGRPVGVTVAKDGALLVSDDGSNSIWRVSWVGGVSLPLLTHSLSKKTER